MKLTHKVLAVGAILAALLGPGATAATAAATPPPPPGASASASPRSLADIKHHVDKHLTKLINWATAERKRVDANPNLTAAQKAKLDGDLNKIVADATTARREVDAAKDRAGLEAARPALQAVKADLQQWRKDWKSMPGAHGSAKPTAPGPSTS
jgi:hypothetical protein